MTRYEVHSPLGAPATVRVRMTDQRRRQAIRTSERLVVLGEVLRIRGKVVGTPQQFVAEKEKLQRYYQSGLIYFCKEGSDVFVSLNTILDEAKKDAEALQKAKAAAAVQAENKRVAAERAAADERARIARLAADAAKVPEPSVAIPPAVEEDDDLRELITADLTMAQLKAICKMVTPVVKSSSSKKATVTKIQVALDDGAELDSAALEALLGE